LTNTAELLGITRKHVRFWIERKGKAWLSGIGRDVASLFPQQNRDIDILACIFFDFWNNKPFFYSSSTGKSDNRSGKHKKVLTKEQLPQRRYRDERGVNSFECFVVFGDVLFSLSFSKR
jgi:hypothetical protein